MNEKKKKKAQIEIEEAYLLDVIGVHNNENTEQGYGDDEAQILESSSHFGREHLREPLLDSDKRLLRIHLLFMCSSVYSSTAMELWETIRFSRESDGKSGSFLDVGCVGFSVRPSLNSGRSSSPPSFAFHFFFLT